MNDYQKIHLPLPKERKILLFFLSVIGSFIIFISNCITPNELFDEDAYQAASNAAQMFSDIKQLRLERGVAIDSSLDPHETGLIGIEYSDITTTIGDLEAKQLSVNPAFAALIVRWLKKRGLNSGDIVAVSFSSSFPALNICTLSALDTLGLKAIIFSSVGASVYGANIPNLTWLDMEKQLVDLGRIKNHSSYASLGGIADTQGGIDGTGISVAEAAILRHGASYIREGTPRDVEEDVLRRMKLFYQHGRPKAFVNVGGNVTSLGWLPEAALLPNGLLTDVPDVNKNPKRGVIFRMFEDDVEVINLLNIRRLFMKNHLIEYKNDHSELNMLHKPRYIYLIQLSVLLVLWLLIGSCFCFCEIRSTTRR